MRIFFRKIYGREINGINQGSYLKRCPIIKGLATVEPYVIIMCPSSVDVSTMVGNFSSDFNMSNNQRFQHGKNHINIHLNSGHLLSRDATLLL